VTWREHVARRDYRAAFEVLGERGMGEETAKAGTIEQLVMLADVARLSGHARAAVAPLRRAAAMEGAAAAVAGYSLGRLLLDELREFGAAATAIEGAIGKGLPGGLDEPALARLVEAHARAKHAADAKRWAEVYERKYPRGREVEAVRRWRAAR